MALKMKGYSQGCEWENIRHVLVPKSQKSWGKSGGQKSDLVKHL